MQGMTQFWTGMFNYTGKMSRKDFWLGSIVGFILFFVVFYILTFVLGFMGGFYDADEGAVEMMAGFLGFLLFMPYLLAATSATVRRLRDGGFNPWWAVGNFIPFVGIATFIFLLFPTKEAAVVTETSTIVE